jgi:hypothetical protein
MPEHKSRHEGAGGRGGTVWAANAGVVGVGDEEHVEVLVLPNKRLRHLPPPAPKVKCTWWTQNSQVDPAV